MMNLYNVRKNIKEDVNSAKVRCSEFIKFMNKFEENEDDAAYLVSVALKVREFSRTISGNINRIESQIKENLK